MATKKISEITGQVSAAELADAKFIVSVPNGSNGYDTKYVTGSTLASSGSGSGSGASGGGVASGLPTTFVSVNKTLQGSSLSMPAGSLRGYNVYVTSGTSYPNKTDGTTSTRSNFNSDIGNTGTYNTIDFVVTGIPDEARYWQFRANLGEGRIVSIGGDSYFDALDNGSKDGVFVIERTPLLVNSTYRHVTSGIINMDFTLPAGESPHWILSPSYVPLVLAQSSFDENNYVISSLSFDGYWL